MVVPAVGGGDPAGPAVVVVVAVVPVGRGGGRVAPPPVPAREHHLPRPLLSRRRPRQVVNIPAGGDCRVRGGLLYYVSSSHLAAPAAQEVLELRELLLEEGETK